MNFLFVDRILELIPGEKAVGVKHVTPHDVYLYNNRDNKLALLPCIVGEALGQLGAWNAMHCNGFTQRPVAGVVGEVRLLGEVMVGETILLETFIEKLDEDAIFYHSEATVNARKILTLTNALGPLLPLEQFNPPEEVKHQFSMIHRPAQSLPASPSMVIPQQFTAHAETVGFDRIIEVSDNQIIAQKIVTLVAPYFVDHFPRKPVLPLSLLLQCKLQLAIDFLNKHFNTDTHGYIPFCIRKVKMNDFVQPGDLLDTTLMLRQITDSQALFRFRSELQGRRVCLGEVVFEKAI